LQTGQRTLERYPVVAGSYPQGAPLAWGIARADNTGYGGSPHAGSGQPPGEPIQAERVASDQSAQPAVSSARQTSGAWAASSGASWDGRAASIRNTAIWGSLGKTSCATLPGVSSTHVSPTDRTSTISNTPPKMIPPGIPTPPGSFVTNELATDCARFLADARRRAHARTTALQATGRFG
jgi:hypothetical protein